MEQLHTERHERTPATESDCDTGDRSATTRAFRGFRGRRRTRVRSTAPSESTLPLSRRSELIHTISAAGGLMGNDHIVSLRTGDGLGQHRAPALGQRICVSG